MPQEVQIRATDRGFDRVGMRFSTLQGRVKNLRSQMISFGASMGVGLGAASLVKGVVDVDAALTRLAIAAGKGPDAIGKLRDQVRAASSATGKSASDLVAGMAKIVEVTGDYDLAIGSLSTIGKVANATGASIEDVAAAAADLGTKMGIKPEGMEKMFAILTTQGKAGAMELKNMAAGFPSLLSGLAGFGVKGEGAMRTFGAFLQVARGGFGTAGETITGVEGLMSRFRDVKVQQRLGAIGVKGVGQKSPVETLMALIQKTGGDPTKMSKVLGGRLEAQKATSEMARMYRETGGFAKLQGLSGVQNLDVLTKDFNTWMTSAAGQLERAKNEAENVAIDKLSSAVRKLATKGDVLVKGINWIGDNLGTVGAGLVAWKLGKGLLGRRGGGAGGIAGAPTPVFVVNMPGGGMPGGGSPGGAGGGKWNAGGVGNVVVAVVQAGGLGYAIGTLIDQATGGKASGGLSEMLFDIFQPGESKRRWQAYLDATLEEKRDKDIAGFRSEQKKDALDQLKVHASGFARTIGGAKGRGKEELLGIAKGTLETEAKGAGFSKGEVEKLIPLLMRIAKGVEKQVVPTFTPGVSRLDLPVMDVSRGPKR